MLAGPVPPELWLPRLGAAAGASSGAGDLPGRDKGGVRGRGGGWESQPGSPAAGCGGRAQGGPWGAGRSDRRTARGQSAEGLGLGHLGRVKVDKLDAARDRHADFRSAGLEITAAGPQLGAPVPEGFPGFLWVQGTRSPGLHSGALRAQPPLQRRTAAGGTGPGRPHGAVPDPRGVSGLWEPGRGAPCCRWNPWGQSAAGARLKPTGTPGPATPVPCPEGTVTLGPHSSRPGLECVPRSPVSPWAAALCPSVSPPLSWRLKRGEALAKVCTGAGGGATRTPGPPPGLGPGLPPAGVGPPLAAKQALRTLKDPCAALVLSPQRGGLAAKRLQASHTPQMSRGRVTAGQG